MSEIDEKLSPDEMPAVAEESTAVNEDTLKALKKIRNNIEQIREIDQSQVAVSREIVNETMKIFQLNNRVIRLADFDGREIVIHPKGFALILSKDGNMEPKQLNDLEPAFLHMILKQLIPKLKESLDERKKSDQNLLEDLIKIRESLV